MEDPGPIALFATIPALFLIGGYIALGIFCAKATWRHTGWVKRPWARRLISTFILAVFFAPGIIGFGTGTEAGVGPVPVWATIIQSMELSRTSLIHNIWAALISFGTTWTIFFAIGTFRANAKTQQKQAQNW